MKKRVLISTLVSFVLLLAVIVAGVCAVYTVTAIDVSFMTCSASGRQEAEEMRETLNRYRGKSSLSLKTESVEQTVLENPTFRVESVEKKYPATLTLTVVERRETFAIAGENGYSILDETGCMLYEKETNSSRIDGGACVLLTGFTFGLEERKIATGDYAEQIFAAFTVFEDALSDVRANILTASLERRGSNSNPTLDFFVLTMREGVTVQIKNPAELTEAKAKAAVEKYLSLSDGERLTGEIDVTDDQTAEGGVNVLYVS